MSSKQCILCGHTCDNMLNFGDPPRVNAQCPECLSLERHRLLWLYLIKEKDFLTNNYRMLHIAPEPCLQKKIDQLPNISYTSIDKSAKNVTVNMDITNLTFSNNSFDFILCSHVLEHIENDQLAMSELYRVLSPKGFAMLLVPISNKEETYENSEIKTPEGRKIHFGQHNHVRWYGKDFSQRIQNAGFQVEVNHYYNTIPNNLKDSYCIKNEILYIGYKT